MRPEHLGDRPHRGSRQEIAGGSGEDVLDGRCRLLIGGSEDVTCGFLRGAEETLRIAQLVGATVFVANSRSPFVWLWDSTRRLVHGQADTRPRSGSSPAKKTWIRHSSGGRPVVSRRVVTGACGPPLPATPRCPQLTCRPGRTSTRLDRPPCCPGSGGRRMPPARLGPFCRRDT